MTIEEILDKARRSGVLGMENQVREAMLAVLDEAVLRAKQYEGGADGQLDELELLRTSIQVLGKEPA